MQHLNFYDFFSNFSKNPCFAHNSAPVNNGRWSHIFESVFLSLSYTNEYMLIMNRIIFEKDIINILSTFKIFITNSVLNILIQFLNIFVPPLSWTVSESFTKLGPIEKNLHFVQSPQHENFQHTNYPYTLYCKSVCISWLNHWYLVPMVPNFTYFLIIGIWCCGGT